MRHHVRFAAVIGAATLSVIAVAPAMAAAPVSQAGANAVTLSLAGNGQGSGDVTAKNDGSQETKTGNATPPLSVLGGQELLSAGVLAQEATAGANGTSAACAGFAGSGGSVVNIGGSRCLNPGTPVNGTLSNLDLNKLVVADPDSALAPVNQVTGPILDQLKGPIGDALEQARAQFGDLGIVAGFGAVEGSCTASPGSASGDATLANAKVVVVLPDQAPQSTLTLLDLPVHPKPNTHLTTNLSDVLDLISESLKTDLNNSLDGAGAPLNTLIDAFQTNIVQAIRDQVEKKLAPLEANLIDVVLNRQIHTDGAIKVRALDLSLAPAAAPQLGASAAELQVGNAACGPNGRVAAVSAPAPAAAPKALPKGVSAGYGSMPRQYATPADDHTRVIVLGAFALLVATGAGAVTFRRLRA